MKVKVTGYNIRNGAFPRKMKVKVKVKVKVTGYYIRYGAIPKKISKSINVIITKFCIYDAKQYILK